MPKFKKTKRTRILNALRMHETLRRKRNSHGSDEETLTKVEWLSCQTDVNKLVQRNGSIDNPLSDNKVEETSNAADTIDIKLPCEIIDEEFITEELYTKESGDENGYNISVTDTQLDELVIEKLLCRCCHAEGQFISLQDSDPHENASYQDMLKACYSIQLCGTEVTGPLRALCGLCAVRLRDAHAFYHQVRACEERFRMLYSNNCIKVTATLDIEAKEESAEANDGDVFDTNADDPVDLDEETVMPKEPLESVLGGQSLLREYLTKKRTPKEVPKQQNAKTTDKKPRKKLPPRRNRSPLPTVLNQYSIRVGENYKCKLCDEIIRKAPTFYKHIRRVHLKRPVRCGLCNKYFKTISEHRKHKLKEHNKAESAKCNACDRVYASAKNLRLHLKSYHMMGEVIKCSMCDYESRSKLSLKRHMVKHKTSKDFQCGYCKKSFSRKKTLQFHERIHTGDKRKVCAECGQAFVQKASLNYHMMKYHPEVKF